METREIHEDELRGLDWTEVESSQIRRLAWLDADAAAELGLVEAESQRADDAIAAPHLLVEFLPRRAAGAPSEDFESVYAYESVPEDVAARLAASSSVGRTLNLAVKGHYPFTKLGVQRG